MTDRFAISAQEEIEDLEFQIAESEQGLRIVRLRLNRRPNDADALADVEWAEREIEEFRDRLAEIVADARAA